MKANLSAKSRVLVFGLTALTDGHTVLYYYLKKFGYRVLIMYQTADRMPSKEIKVDSYKVTKIPVFDFIQFLKRTWTFRPEIIEIYLHKFTFLGGVSECIFLFFSNLLAKRINLVCTGREILGWNNHPWSKRLAVRLAYRFSTAVLIKESYMYDNIVKYRIGDPLKAHFIHNGVYEHFKLTDFPKPKNKTIGLFINSFKKWRNVDLLAQVAKKLVKERDDILFFIVGGRNEMELDICRDILEDLPDELKSRVQIHEMNNNRQFYYSLADFFVLPADLVWLNNSVIEAMLMKKVVILPNVEWVDKIVADGQNGLIFTHKDPDSLLAKITTFLDMDLNERTQIGEEARKTVLSKFSARKRACLHFAYFEKILYGKEIPYELYDPCGNFEVRTLSSVLEILNDAGIDLPCSLS